MVSTSTPTPIPVKPTEGKTATPEGTPVTDGLLPESGGGTSGTFLILALGGTLLLLGWFVHFTFRHA
ncbi:MAG: hypothetical protein AB8I69_23845 [Anaerolineae bacterium]